jgi:renalase
VKSKPPSVAVIGAGISGLTCAANLVQQGIVVEVFEKSRGPGGRMATRRHEGATFDHGAQFFRTHSAQFSQEVQEWEAKGCAAIWDGRFANLSSRGLQEDADTRHRWVGSPKMNAITRSLSSGLFVHWRTRVTRLVRGDAGWRLMLETGDTVGNFDSVVLSCPGPQAADLSPAIGAVFERSKALSYGACWAVMVSFADRLKVPFDGIRSDIGPFSWLARDSSKPGRPPGERWILHGSPAFSAQHIEDSPDEVADFLVAEFIGQFGGQVTHKSAHRWRFALAEGSAAGDFEWEKDIGLGLCGDALIGPRVESAWKSGCSLAQVISDAFG